MHNTLVYIDDEALLCAVFKEYFANASTHVFTFTEPDLALEFCQRNRVDLVVIDFRLIGTTGAQVAAQLPADLPKILVTGELTSPADDAFAHIVHKPFKLSELQRVIQPFLRF